MTTNEQGAQVSDTPRMEKGAKMPSILDPKFKYVPAAQTDISKRFKAIIRQQKEQQKKPASATVRQIRSKAK